jgi:hypothetical protein
MCAGIAVLGAGAVLNLAGATRPAPAIANWAFVLLSNGVMAAVLTTQLRVRGVPPVRTLSLWLGVLDGAGALLFWSLRGVTGGL